MSPIPSPVPARRLKLLALAVALSCLTPAAHALRIGAAEVRSALGQPLDLVVPISAEGDPSFQSECVRVLREQSDDGIPGPGLTRLEMSPRGGDFLLRVRSTQPVFEPAIKLVLEAGCGQRVRRDFVLLLDPPVARESQTRPIELSLVLGEPVLSSGQGEALRLRVPVIGRDAATLDASCVAAATQPGGPAQVLLRRAGEATTLLISTPAPLQAARVGVSVQAGCESPVLREYSLLLAQPALATAGAPAPSAAPRAAKPPRPLREAGSAAPTGSKRAGAAAAGASPAASGSEVAPPASRAGDRLVLAEPAAPAEAPISEREAAIAAQVEALGKEMAQLREELAQAQARNEELLRLQASLSGKQAEAQAKDAPSYAWIFATIAAGALALGLLIAWRQRRPAAAGWADEHPPEAGPATRLGLKRAEAAPAPTTARIVPTTIAPRPAAAASSSQAAPALATASAAAVAPLAAAAVVAAAPDDDHAIHVTEFSDTGQLIEDLYADYLESPAPAVTSLGDIAPSLPVPAPVAAMVPPPAAQPATAGAAPRVDFDLGSQPDPLTGLKTEVAIDLDVGTLALPTQVIGDWDQELFMQPKGKPAAGPLSPVDFELSIDLPGDKTPPARG